MLPLAHISPLTALLPTDGSATDQDIISTACTFSVWQNASGNGLGAMLTLDRLQLYFMQNKSTSGRIAHGTRPTATNAEPAAPRPGRALPQPPQPASGPAAPPSPALPPPTPGTATKPSGLMHLHLLTPREEVREDVVRSIVQTFASQGSSVPKRRSSTATRAESPRSCATIVDVGSSTAVQEGPSCAQGKDNSSSNVGEAATDEHREDTHCALGLEQAVEVNGGSNTHRKAQPLDFVAQDQTQQRCDVVPVIHPERTLPLTPPTMTAVKRAHRNCILSPPFVSSLCRAGAAEDRAGAEKSVSLDLSAIDATPSCKVAVSTPTHAEIDGSHLHDTPEAVVVAALAPTPAPTSVPRDVLTDLDDDRAAKYHRIEHVATLASEQESKTARVNLAAPVLKPVSSAPVASLTPPEGALKNLNASQASARTVPLPKRNTGAPTLSTQRRALRTAAGGSHISSGNSSSTTATTRPLHTELFALPVQPPSPAVDKDKSAVGSAAPAAAPPKPAPQSSKAASPPPPQQRSAPSASATVSTSTKRPPRVYHPPS